MTPTMSSEVKKRASSIQVNAAYKNHHLAGPFLPQTPIGSETPTPERSDSPAVQHQLSRTFLTRWSTEPSSSIKLLVFPILLSLNWELVSLFANLEWPNPFSRIFLLSGYIQGSKHDDPRYQKSWWDVSFLVYYVVFFAFIRQCIFIYIARPLAKYFGLRRPGKVDRFGEQTYALIYFAVFGAWGYRVMTSLPTYWFNTIEFWIGYPYWDMKPELKCYYLLQFSHWLQEFLVLVLGLEKARKDYLELVAHHLVTLWLIGWSYLVNMTYIGSAVYMSMDIPDAFLSLSKLLNYIQWNQAKIYSFIVFFAVWSYFRHYLNIWLLWSIWFEFSSLPESSKRWSWSDGVYMSGWMKYQIFTPMLLLQVLNLFWYSLMVKILVRALKTAEAEDDRSDDEGEDDENSKKKED